MPSMGEPTREQAWDLVCEWVTSDALRKHMLGVEAAMRAYARHYGEDEELWAVTGLVHDLDYERFPDLDDTENGHPRTALRLFEEMGWPQELIDAVAGHAIFLGVPRETLMAKTLFAVDELSGFIAACAMVRPTGIEGMAPKSVKKKLKQPSFAAGVNRDEVRQGAEELGVDFDEHVAFVIAAMADARRRARPRAARAAAAVMKRRWKILIGLARRADRAAGGEHDHRRRPDQGSRGDDRRRRDPQPARRRGAGVRRGRAGIRRLGRAPPDRAPALLLVLAALVRRAGADPRREPSRDSHRPARSRRRQKPSSGYSIEDQAELVGAALDRLGVQGAVVVGHSMGFSVATALAERSSQLVDRLVNIDEGPTEDSCEIPFIAKLGFVPVIGEAMWRLTPELRDRGRLRRRFCPRLRYRRRLPQPRSGRRRFPRDDLHGLSRRRRGERRLRRGDPADERLSQVPVPLLSIFGAEDQICDPEVSQEAYSTVPGARVAEIPNAGHSPNVEQPEKTAALIEEFAAEAGDEANDPLAKAAAAAVGAVVAVRAPAKR